MYSKEEEPEIRRFYWQTQNPYIISKEQELLKSLEGSKGIILEVGCGEGANLVNLRRMGVGLFYYGVDISFGKVHFASLQKGVDARFICGDAVRLPFKDGRFNTVLLRDLLHHVDNNREDVLKEIFRVCQKRGYIYIIEGNGAKLTSRVFSLVTPNEKGVRNSTQEKLVNLINGLQIDNFDITTKEPFSLFRFFLHYRYGIKSLGKLKCIRRILDLAEKIAERIICKSKWAYIVAIVRKEGHA